MLNNAMQQIKASLEDQDIVIMDTIKLPVEAEVARVTTKSSYLEYSDVTWIALIVLAGIIIVACLIMVACVCYQWSRSDSYFTALCLLLL